MYIGIIGCMGVGKSRLTAALAKHLGYQAFFEPVEENPYLDDYYADPKRYACLMQFFMLTHRFRQHQEIQALRQQQIGVVQDQIIFGDVLYAEYNHQIGTIDDRDYQNYRTHFEALRPLLQLPDVIVNLVTSIDTVYDRIQRRGRTSEHAVSREFLHGLTDLFTKWTATIAQQTTIIHLDWSTFRPIDEVVKEIEGQLAVQLVLPVKPQRPIKLP